MLSKEELEKKRKFHVQAIGFEHWNNAMKSATEAWDRCTEILWPEIERLSVVVNEINEALRETIKENETLSSSPSIAEANRLREENERMREELQAHKEQNLARMTIVAELERKLEKAKEALQFYADRNNWKGFDTQSEVKDVITFSDISAKNHKDGTHYMIGSGGNRARGALKEIE